MSRKTVIHVTQVGGGIQTYLEQIFKNINKDKFRLILICPFSSESLIACAKKYDIECYTIRMVWEINPLRDIRAIINLIKLFKKLKADLIHVHSSKGGMLGRIAGFISNKKVLYTPNAYAYLGANGLKKMFYKILERLTKQITSVLLASSESEKNRSLIDLGYKDSKVKVFPNSIDIIEPLESTHSKSEIQTVLTVGRLVYQKNPLMFVDSINIALKEKAFKAKIIGIGFEDKLIKEVRDRIDYFGISDSIELVSWMGRNELIGAIGNSDVFVMSSRFESFGYVAAEAQMMERPVVATDVDGLNEIVEHEITGYLVESGDAEKMASYIIHLLDSKDKAIEMGKKGRQRVLDKFDIVKNIPILERVYSEQ